MRILAGKKGTYAFDTQPESILKLKGKTGPVFLGYNRDNGQKVVIRQLLPKALNAKSVMEQALRETQFENVPVGIIKPDEVLIDQGDVFIIKPYIEGISLDKFARHKGKLPFTQTVFAIRCIIAALGRLQQLHLAGIIHADIRPANMILHLKKGESLQNITQPDIRLIDLGLALPIDRKSLIQSGDLPYGLVYSAPEQVLNLPELIGPWTDVFAMGLSLFELIEGKIPYSTEHPELLVHLQINQRLPDIESMPAAFNAILGKACFKYAFPKPPNQYPREHKLKLMLEGIRNRYPGAINLAEALEQFLNSFQEKDLQPSWWSKWMK
jgi:eukaryotic-like serine/threonine-protein kinase